MTWLIIFTDKKIIKVCLVANVEFLISCCNVSREYIKKNIFDFGGGSHLDGEPTPYKIIVSISKQLFGIKPKIVNSESEDYKSHGDELFDAVISFDVIEHLHPTDVGRYLEDIFKKKNRCCI